MSVIQAADITGLPQNSVEQYAEEFESLTMPQVRACCDVTGTDPRLLVMLHRKYGCEIDLFGLAMPDQPTPTWPEATRADLEKQGVPVAHIRIIRSADDLRRYEMVCNLGGFGLQSDIRQIKELLSKSLLPGGVVIADIRKGSGGIPFLRRRVGSVQTVGRWKTRDDPVLRVLARSADRAGPAVTQDLPEPKPGWSEIAPTLIGEEGFFRENDQHSFTYIPRGDVLCVTFDNLDIAMNKRADRRPWGFSFVEKQGWSMLGVMAEGWTWFRDPWVWSEFDRLRDTGFFHQFRRVIFYGASMGGYGALVFSAACPGAQVVAFSPQTTLDKTVVPWETRYKAAWGYDYSGPYGDAAAMTAPAHRVNLFYDPYSELDKAHIDRLSGSNLGAFSLPFLRAPAGFDAATDGYIATSGA